MAGIKKASIDAQDCNSLCLLHVHPAQTTGIVGFAVVPNAREVSRVYSSNLEEAFTACYLRDVCRLLGSMYHMFHYLLLSGALQHLCQNTCSAATTAQRGSILQADRADSSAETPDCTVGKPSPALPHLL